MKRVALLVLCLVIIFSSMFVVAEHFGYTNQEYLQHEIEAIQQRPGGQWTVAGVIVGLLVADIILPIPSSLVMALAGKILGIWAGACASFVGNMLAAGIGYLACRRWGIQAFRRIIGEEDTAHLEAWYEKYGVFAIICSRPVPMMTEVLSCLAGVTGLPPRIFFGACALGFLPLSLVYASVGNLGDLTDPWPAVVIALVIPALGWIVVSRIRNRAS